jgi:hypothetical protein
MGDRFLNEFGEFIQKPVPHDLFTFSPFHFFTFSRTSCRHGYRRPSFADRPGCDGPSFRFAGKYTNNL